MYKKRMIQMLPVLILLCFFYCIGETQTKREGQVDEMVADVPEDEASEEKEILADVPEDKSSEEKEILVEEPAEVEEEIEENNNREENDLLEKVNLSNESAEREYRAKSVCIRGRDGEDAFNENIVGYTLGSMGYGNEMHYYQEPDWVLPEELAGKGVYVSEHMCETEVFLGRKLATLLVDRGEVREEDRQYYTDWAMQQLKSTDWDLLDSSTYLSRVAITISTNY